MSNHSKVSIMYEIDASDMFRARDVNFRYAQQRAAFSHQEDCEFIFFVGWPQQLERAQLLGEMRNFGCTENFVTAMKLAMETGCRWALFYAK